MLVWTDYVLMVKGILAMVFLTSWHQPVIHEPEVDFVLKSFGRLLVEVDYRPKRGEVLRWLRDAGLGIDFRGLRG